MSALVPALEGIPCTWTSAAITESDRTIAPAATGPLLPSGTAALRVSRLHEKIYGSSCHGISNRTPWFLQHHLPDVGAVAFDRGFQDGWHCYRAVNRAFAEACDGAADAGAEVHVEGYHLGLVPEMLRERRPDLRILHHVCRPWTDPEYFGLLPDAVAEELLTACSVPTWSGS